MNNHLSFLILLVILLSSIACTGDKVQIKEVNNAEITSMMQLIVRNCDETGIDFSNDITESDQHNIYNDLYLYNGGGVGIIDINNDGLQDIFLTGNQVSSELYLNEGNLKFKNVTKKANVSTTGWCTGVTIVDINQDGFQDMYVCRAGAIEKDPKLRSNLLFINNQDGTFSEKASEYGIDDSAHNVDAAFVDFNLDGLLDLYTSTYYPGRLPLNKNEYDQLNERLPSSKKNKVYLNNGNGKFLDKSVEMGINSVGYGLDFGISDFNEDAYPDIYQGNDFEIDDQLLMNSNGRGFSDLIKSKLKHTANFSMGLDIADFNNDLHPDILVLDMNPANNFRQKVNMPSMNPEKFAYALSQGHHPQYMRNVLQLNTGLNQYADIGQMAGIEKTDWSWAALMIDLDNDAWKDIIVTNGIVRDVDNKDIVNFIDKKTGGKPKNIKWSEIKDKLPSNKIESFVFKNNRDLTFDNKNDEWGFSIEEFSNGAAYADLDLDGDLDIVVNNINECASIIENKANTISGTNFIRFKLRGASQNLDGIGSRLEVSGNFGDQMQEFYPSRGFQSSQEHFVHFGIGDAKTVGEVLITWPDGKTQKVNNLQANQTYTLKYLDAETIVPEPETRKNRLFATANKLTRVNHVHEESDYNDYDDQVLLPHKMSHFGPSLAVADVNGDQLTDFIVGGSSGRMNTLYLQQRDRTFAPSNSQPWQSTMNREANAFAFFDIDKDGDQDLFIANGSYEFKSGAPQLADELYINNGQGNFTLSNNLPILKSNSSCVCAEDFDNDGDIDLFVGARSIGGNYPIPDESYFLENKSGTLSMLPVSNIDESIQNQLTSTCAAGDIDGDGIPELILAGDWTEIMFYNFKNGALRPKENVSGISGNFGWWNTIKLADIDKDGDKDLIAGNLGLNYKYKASLEAPFNLHFGDLNSNGHTEIVFGYFENDIEFPLRGLQCSSEQMPELKKRIGNYTNFASSTLIDIYGDDLNNANTKMANNFKTSIFINDSGNFSSIDIPNEVQISPTFGIEVDDFNKDGHNDIVFVGNLMVSEVETGDADAGFGVVLAGNGKNEFRVINQKESGLFAPFDTRSLANLSLTGQIKLLLIGNNNGPLQTIAYQ